MKTITLLITLLVTFTGLSAKPIFPPSEEFLVEVAQGSYSQYELITKFGHNSAVDSTLAPVSSGAIYMTPSTGIKFLEILSSDADDTVAGAGARVVRIEGLDALYGRKTLDVEMNGVTPVPADGWSRVFRLSVLESGSYASAVNGSHQGTITLREDSGGGDTWATIDVDSVTGFPLGQSEIGAYTIPAGYTGYLLFKHVSVDANKLPTIFWFRRDALDVLSAPFSSMRLFERHVGVVGSLTYNPPAPIIELPEKTDIGAMAYVATGTAAVSVEFQILLVRN